MNQNDDYVSRQLVLDIIRGSYINFGDMVRLTKRVKKLPAVTDEYILLHKDSFEGMEDVPDINVGDKAESEDKERGTQHDG